LRSVSLGVSYSAGETEQELANWESFVSYRYCEDIYETTAGLLARNEVIGWFSGREEYGPRALGNRSILADPRPAENKDRINAIVKMREGFRPFAPAITEEHASDYFHLPASGKTDFPFMTFTLKVKEEYSKILGAVVHEDGTARVQTVSRKDNEPFWQLIQAFYKRTGTPVLLNTSFNNNFEPIVHHPADAIAFLLTSDIRYLVVNGFLVEKKDLMLTGDPGPLSIQPLEHLVLSPAAEAGNRNFFLHDVYLKKNIVISEKLWAILSRGDTVNLLEDEVLYREVKDLWRRRSIKISPCSKSVPAISAD
jgi:carbamoyltransferase